MAIRSKITNGSVLLITTDTNPNSSGGTSGSVGSICQTLDGSGTFTKIGGSNTSWSTSLGINGYNVKDYGLVGDGITDDSTALNTLLNTTAPAGSAIFFPQGTYLISGVITAKVFNYIGCGSASIIKVSNDATSLRLDTGSDKSSFRNLKFLGTAIGASQNGINFNSSGFFSVTECEFASFGNSAITATNIEFSNELGGIIDSCRFNANTYGIDLVNRGEYVTISSSYFVGNTNAIRTSAGNTLITGNYIAYNTNGIEITSGTNNAHGVISNNQINHQVTYAINLHDFTTGQTLIGNHIIAGTIRIANTTGLSINGGQLNVDAYTIDTNIGLVFDGVRFPASLANTITLVGNKPNYIGCYNTSGASAVDADTFTAAAFLVDNGNEAKPIFIAQDNNSTIFRIADGGAIDVGTWNGSVIGSQYGGTGFGNYTIGDLLYASGASTLSKLSDVAAGSYLRSGGVGVAPVYSTLILPNSATANRIVYATGTNTWGEDANLVWNRSAFVAGTTGALGASDVANFYRNQNNATYLRVLNNTSGTVAQAGVAVSANNGSTSGLAVAYSAGYTTAGLAIANTFALITNLAAGMSVGTLGATPVILGTNNAENWRIASGGNLSNTGSSGTAYVHLKAGTASASSAPLKLTSGTNNTTAETGAIEYNGTNLFFTRTGTTRENVWVGNDAATAPATNAIGVIADYYGTSATRVLTTPNSWASVNIGGTTYKIPLYS